jgi:acyl carrier protein
MESDHDLKNRIRQLIIDNLMLKMGPESIGDDVPLFGPTGLGLDSVDALQLVVALDKNFGIKIPDQNTANTVLENVNSIALAVKQKQAAA